MRTHDEQHEEPLADMAEFGRELDAIRPRLPEAAMGRIGDSMYKELRRTTVRRSIVFTLSAGSLAAAVVLAVTFAFTSLPGLGPARPTTASKALPEKAPGEVCDHIRVAMKPQPATVLPGDPLISIEPYRSLVEEVN